MNLVVKLKLVTTFETDQLLRETAEQYRLGCNHLSKIAFSTRIFNRYDLQELAYHETRSLFNIPSQRVIRAIAQVCSAYKSLRTQIKNHNLCCEPQERRYLTQIEFAPNLAVPYDQRILSYDTHDAISLRLLKVRISFAFKTGQRQLSLLHNPRGQAHLKRYGKEWFLFQTVEVEEPDLLETTNHLGVDCGIATVASSHDGCQTQRFAGNSIRQCRKRFSQIRRGLQHHHTKSSRSRVRLLRNRKSRRARHFNHLVSCRIVMQAKRTNSTIVLEDLKDVNEGLRVQKSQGYDRLCWSYHQLQQMIIYKAKLAGIPVMFVPPDYTSKTCSQCHYMHDCNRQTQAWFKCRECGFCWNADDNAAINIRFLGAESACRKRTVCMQEVLHSEGRKLRDFSPRSR